MRRKLLAAAAAVSLLVADGYSTLAAAAVSCPDIDPAKVELGLRLSPVHLNVDSLGRRFVGYGSYLVNAIGGCNDCHTNPPFAAGHNPFLGQSEKINAAGYLGGGQAFGPGLISANITPDAHGLPAGHTLREFREDIMRRGRDPDEPGHILQVMPWPTFGKMTDCDIASIYRFLQAIPSLPGNRD